MAQWPWRCMGEARAQSFASVNLVSRRQICINLLFIVSASGEPSSSPFLAASALLYYGRGLRNSESNAATRVKISRDAVRGAKLKLPPLCYGPAPPAHRKASWAAVLMVSVALIWRKNSRSCWTMRFALHMGRSHIRFLPFHGVRETNQPPHKLGSTAASALLLFLWAWQWGISLRCVSSFKKDWTSMSGSVPSPAPPAVGVPRPLTPPL